MNSHPSAAERRLLMDRVVVPNPRAQKAHETFDYLTELRKLDPDGPKRCVSLIAPSQTGKTIIIDSYVARLNTKQAAEDGQIPALKVALSANRSKKTYAKDILMAFEGHGYETLVERGTEADLLRRVDDCCRARGVEILFLDEFHHLVHSDTQKETKTVSETVKLMLLEGSCPIVIAGMKGAHKVFANNEQLAHRAEPPIGLDPLCASRDDDRDLYWNFLSDYLVSMEAVGAASDCTWILEGGTPAKLLQASDGVLGATCNLLKGAVRIAA